MPRAASCVGIQLHAHGVFLRAVNLHARHAADHGDALRQQRLGILVHRVERQRGRGERQVEDRLLGRIHLLIRRRVRHVGRQRAAGFRDGGLDILRGRVDVALQRELHRDGGAALRVGRAHRSMPAMVENSRSSGVATDDAMVSGLAPGSAAFT